MKFDVLYNFISPVTGRVLCDPNYVLMGDSRGIAIPSPIITNILDASFVIGFPNTSLPNAQVLNALANGYLYNTAGTLSTTPTVIPFLTEKKLWIGDATNTPTEYSTIFLENLPPLRLTEIPDPISADGFVGQYYEGTASGVPEVSSRIGFMFADIAYINIRIFALETVQFIIADANVINRALFASAQFLADLVPVNGGIAKIQAVTGKIQLAVSGTDYLDVGGASPGDGVIPILQLGPYPPNPKLVYPSTIHIIGNNDIQNVNSLKAAIVAATNAVTSDDIMVARNSLQTLKLELADPTSRFTTFARLEAKSGLIANVQWTLPDQQGKAGQVLTNTDGSQLQWGTPANINARYIVQTSDLSLANAQALNDLVGDEPRILKADAKGIIEVAELGKDYGNVSGPDPAVSTDKAIAIWDGDTGRKIKNSNITISADSNIEEVNSIYVDSLILCKENIVAEKSISTPSMSIVDSAGFRTASFEASDGMASNVKWDLPATQGKAGEVLTNIDGIQLGWTDSNGNVSGPDPAVSTDGGLAIWDGITGRKIQDCTIKVVGGDSIQDVNSIYATNTIKCQDMNADNTVTAQEVAFYNRGNNVAFRAPPLIFDNVTWILPATSGDAGQVLTNVGGVPNTNLEWKTPASSDAYYIVQTKNVSLPNAQALDELAGVAPRILKSNDKGGAIEIAIAGDDYGTVSGPAASTPENIAVWNDDGDGKTLKNGILSIQEIQAQIDEVQAAATAAQTAAEAAQGTAATALEQAEQALFAAGAAGVGSIFGGLFGATRRGPAGAAGTPGLVGAPGAAGAAGQSTLVIDTNISVSGGRIQNIAASPQADFDAVSAKWVWDLLNDNVEIKWE